MHINQQKTYEISVSVKEKLKGEIELLKNVFKAIGIKEKDLIECHQNHFVQLAIYVKDRTKAQRLKRRIQALKLKGVKLFSKTLKTRDWQCVWKTDYKPFKLTSRFDVIPFAYRNKRRPGNRTPIYIDTSFAFGTGLHATTHMMARLIERMQGRFKTFFDIGTGTGILSIVALQCGAQTTRSIDLKREIIAITRENLEANGFSKKGAMAVNFENIKHDRTYDFVAANLITQDLIHFSRKLVKCINPGKYLAVSGISLSSYERYRKTFDRLPLKCLKIEKKEGWVAMLYKKT